MMNNITKVFELTALLKWNPKQKITNRNILHGMMNRIRGKKTVTK